MTPLMSPLARLITGLTPERSVHLYAASNIQPLASYCHDVQPLSLSDAQSAQQAGAEGTLALYVARSTRPGAAKREGGWEGG